jgi:hypothetical protein
MEENHEMHRTPGNVGQSTESKIGGKPMTKRQTIRYLNKLIVTLLFRNRHWRMNRDKNISLHEKLCSMGLQEYLPNSPNTIRNTPLGDECDLDLLNAFMGLFDEHEIPYIIAEHGLMSKQERDSLEQGLDAGADPEITLRRRVQKAYRDYCSRTSRNCDCDWRSRRI